jgi:hypothetical protein
MDDLELVRTTLAALTRRLRLVRACSLAARFLVAGLFLGLIPLLLKRAIPAAPLAALALGGGVTLLGFLYGLFLKLPRSRVALLADQRLHFHERLTSAEESLGAPPESDMVRAQLADTARGLRGVRPRQVFALVLPGESRWAPPLAALALALALLPPLAIHLPSRSDEEKRPAAGAAAPEAERPLEQKPAPLVAPRSLFPKGRERSVDQGSLAGRNQQGDLAAVFKDTKLSQQRPDFGSFVKQGDDRLKLLERPESLPDLHHDFTQSPYQVMVNHLQQQLRQGRLNGLTWDQIQRLLSEMGQGQPQPGTSGLPDELSNELNGQAGASTDRMLSALSRALNRMREKTEAGQGSGKSLKEAPNSEQAAKQGGEREKGGQDQGGTGGSLPGKEKSLQTRGAPTPRIAGEKQDSTLEGEMRNGQMEAYNTNLSGGGAQNTSHLPYMDVFSQYKKAMEETLTKEPIPFSYREQVKQYFQSLEAR